MDSIFLEYFIVAGLYIC